MRILHYTLGIPPLRTGGLVDYALQLAEEEQIQGHEIILFYPGFIRYGSSKMRIQPDRQALDRFANSYVLRNSLPLVLSGGIKRAEPFLVKGDYQQYIRFLQQTCPDIIHVHTLMGIHQVFFTAAAALGIKVIFSTHDYFGLAPTPSFFNPIDNRCFAATNSLADWLACRDFSHDPKMLRLFQTPMYPALRKISHLRSRSAGFQTRIAPADVSSSGESIQAADPLSNSSQMEQSSFDALRRQYRAMLQSCSGIHYTSQLSQQVYQNCFEKQSQEPPGRVIPLTSQLVDKARTKPVRQYDKANQITRFGYIGPYQRYKGFPLLLAAFQKAFRQSESLELHCFGDDHPIHLPAGAYHHGRFNRAAISDVFAQIDLLILPSIWKETMGLVVVEALSQGTPALVSNFAGAAEWVHPDFVFHPSVEDLTQKMLWAHESNWQEYQATQTLPTFSEHTAAVLNFCQEVSHGRLGEI